MSEDKGFQTDWNQSMATHMRLDKLFMACHIALDEESWDSLYKNLHSLYAESSSVLSDEEEKRIQECLGELKKFFENEGVHSAWERVEAFTECQVVIRNALQSHGMMIQKKHEQGPAGR